MLSQALDLLIEFLPWFAAVYGVNVALYFLTGWALIAFQNRWPERRIQPNRRGEKRRAKEQKQSVLSLLVTGGCLAGGLFAQHKGWTLWAPLELSWWSIPLMAVVSIVAFDAWFYWMHRFMHTKLMYRFHAEHHKSVAPTVWSTYNDDFVDAFVMQCYYLWAPLILPIPGLVLVAHRLYDHFNGTIGHSGFEFYANPSARAPWPMVCVTFHDQHHSRFRYNYANFFSFWDRVMGTLDPKYDAAVKGFEEIAEKRPVIGRPAAE
ncbi:Sterol desaturase/sphingolipid hydroxylase, fatty acid hydroxylase superfamily [Albimonas donghaensis]|uniref:Sterol desaturase/sphingolipid hydroxylase, fatty acid hydroxylase superfamily n=1 Tax=Albimonas donghaensis TaxID=356660 RepID=A0A1H2YXJ4_9RHOB|nr:sterol desaturase family protein [Albimonas donghaensis]SDX09279.1 Sterol desaturase/sphingolipid hydroxylase, fatty acid hydroxylase superfamily [Albimonas donghaensis]